jgi:signal transduction histidine kinase
MLFTRESGVKEGSRFSTRFASKLNVAFGVMLLMILALAWYFSNSVELHEQDIKRISRSNQILQNYHLLASQTWRLLNDLNVEVTVPDQFDPLEWQLEAGVLRQTIEALRNDISNEANHPGGNGVVGGLERLAELERVIDQIIASQATIAQALDNGLPDDAAADLRRLHDDGLIRLFAQMIEAVTEEQQEVVNRSQTGAIDLAGYISGLLPALASLLILGTIVMAWLFSRSLTRSLHALRKGAMAFSTGNFDYRIPQLKEAEFTRLGEGFNTMAHELAEHRSHLDKAKVRLEAVVEERTRALRTSNEKLAAIDDKRRQLLADISHEFRTPLTVIQGEAEIALRGKSKKPEEYQDSIQRILNQSRQTTRLVDDLLFIARAEVGEPRLDLGETEVVDLLTAVCDEFAAKAEKKDIVIKQKIPQSRPVLFADSGRLRQVFRILLDNAVKYSREGQTVDVALESETDTVVVSVSDRGIGLTEDELKHVFIRFYRSKDAEGHESGTGLGLPVAKAIVEAHEGEITLESRPGGGTTAWVRLPIHRELGESA